MDGVAVDLEGCCAVKGLAIFWGAKSYIARKGGAIGRRLSTTFAMLDARATCLKSGR
jgi:hypothetical protein